MKGRSSDSHERAVHAAHTERESDPLCIYILLAWTFAIKLLATICHTIIVKYMCMTAYAKTDHTSAKSFVDFAKYHLIDLHRKFGVNCLFPA